MVESPMLKSARPAAGPVGVGLGDITNNDEDLGDDPGFCHDFCLSSDLAFASLMPVV